MRYINTTLTNLQTASIRIPDPSTAMRGMIRMVRLLRSLRDFLATKASFLAAASVKQKKGSVVKHVLPDCGGWMKKSVPTALINIYNLRGENNHFTKRLLNKHRYH